jgi:acetate---CoA ligase (ADP-forming)
VTDSTFGSFFAPRGVVVVGVSQDPAKLGYGLARNLVRSGYTGAIHLVNPRGGELFGLTVSRDLEAVPDPVDLAVLATPAPAMAETLRACHARGIRTAIVASGGFKEVGPEGAALERGLAAVARELGMRVLGPNCIGLLDTHLPIDTTFLPPPAPGRGEIAFLSHSGAICGAVVDLANGRGFGLSRLVSLGNQADLTEADFLAPVAEDPNTRVLTLYLEGVGDGPRFVAEATAVSRSKPIVALKVGRYAGGRRAAASHTGALAGTDSAFDAAFRRAGVLRAETTEQMFDWARALAACPLPKGRAMAILTNAGGPGVVAADALELGGLTLADLGEETRNALKALLSPAASVANPVDMLAAASAEQYARCLELLLADAAVHGVIVLLPPPPMILPESVAIAILPVIQRAAKPVVVGLLGANLIKPAAELFATAGVADYRFPEQAASALGALARRAELVAAGPPAPLALEGIDRAAAAEPLGRVAQAGGGWLTPEDTTVVLGAYGIRTPRVEWAGSAEHAAELARAMGFPVVLKLASPDITHKSDVGGVVLDLRTHEEVAAAYEAVLKNARIARPEAKVLGVHLQPMLAKGQEVIVGAVRDAQFGPLVMFGSGGVEVEGLKDVAFGLAPLPRAEAEEMLERTWAGRKLRGFRNLPAADREAVLDALLRLAQLVADCPGIAEAEINPLRALAAGQGAVALDARIRVAAAG